MDAETMGTPPTEDNLRVTLNRLRKEAHTYSSSCSPCFSATLIVGTYDPFSALPDPLRVQSDIIRANLAELAKRIGPAIRRSPLLTQADEHDAGYAIKGMQAALRYRAFQHWDAELLHDEGTVLGVQSAGQSQNRIVSLGTRNRNLTNGPML